MPDTGTNGITDNVEPNIYCKGFSVPTSKTTKTFNVTKFTPAYAQAFMGSQSHMVFSQGDTYTIPFVYQEMSPVAPADPVQYKYIHNFKIIDADFVGIDQVENLDFVVSEAWPNPANSTVSFEMSLRKPMACRFNVYSITGQEIFRSSVQSLTSGTNQVNIDIRSWKSGVYFVSFNLGSNTQTKKIIVR